MGRSTSRSAKWSGFVCGSLVSVESHGLQAPRLKLMVRNWSRGLTRQTGCICGAQGVGSNNLVIAFPAFIGISSYGAVGSQNFFSAGKSPCIMGTLVGKNNRSYNRGFLDYPQVIWLVGAAYKQSSSNPSLKRKERRVRRLPLTITRDLYLHMAKYRSIYVSGLW